MNRTEKKCFIASTGFHLLMLLILFIGPAFLSSKQPPDITIDFIPSKLVDAAVAGGGSPLARPPTPAPQQVKQPTPAPQQVPEPLKPKSEPPKPIVKETKLPEPEPEKVVKNTQRDPNSLETTQDKKPKKPMISLKPVVRGQEKPTTRRETAAEREAKELADSRAAASRAIKNAAATLRASSASATVVDDEFGPGGGGPVYASYAAWVKKVYEDAWEEPANASKDDAVAKATVTIAQDGTILNARITTSSGDSQVDASVRRTLDRVKTIGLPFPDGIKEKQRTYVINFNLKAKRLIG